MAGKQRSLLVGQARLVRGAVLGSGAVLLSLAVHGSAGCSPLGPGTALALAVGVSLGLTVADRRGTFPRLLVVLAMLQVLLHLLSVVASGHHGGALLPTPAMLMAHGIATIALAFVLAHADTIAHRWAAFLRLLGASIPRLTSVIAHDLVLVPATTVPSFVIHAHTRSFGRRGPPSFE